jgi:hypothetical protein
MSVQRQSSETNCFCSFCARQVHRFSVRARNHESSDATVCETEDVLLECLPVDRLVFVEERCDRSVNSARRCCWHGLDGFRAAGIEIHAGRKAGRSSVLISMQMLYIDPSGAFLSPPRTSCRQRWFSLAMALLDTPCIGFARSCVLGMESIDRSKVVSQSEKEQSLARHLSEEPSASQRAAGSLSAPAMPTVSRLPSSWPNWSILVPHSTWRTQ